MPRLSKQERSEVNQRKFTRDNMRFYKTILGETIIENLKVEYPNIKLDQAIRMYVNEKIRSSKSNIYEKLNMRNTPRYSNFDEIRIKVLGDTEKNFFSALEQVKMKLEFEHNKILFVKVMFKDFTTGEVQWRSINMNEFSKEKHLIKKIKEYSEGEPTAGSDTVNYSYEESYEWDSEYFDLIYFKPHIGNGRKTKRSECLFKHEDLGKYEYGDCGRLCLEFAGIYMSKEQYKKMELFKLDNLKNYLITKNLPIKIVANYIETMVMILPNQKIDGRRVMKIDYKNVLNHVIYEPPYDPEFFIIYDPRAKHYDISEELELDNVYSDSGHVLYKFEEGKLKQLYKSHGESAKVGDLVYGPRKQQTRYLYFDIETVTDYEDRLINTPYSISFLDLDESDIDTLVNIEDKKNEDALKIFIKEKATFYHGPDCVKRFVDYIELNDCSCVYQLISFNGSNFDNFLVYNTCNRYYPDIIGDPLIANGQLLNFKLFGKNYPKDIRKFVSGSLKANCKAYGIELCAKKDGFSHTQMQEKYDNGELWDFIKDSEKLEEYNTFDVLSLAVLYGKFTKAIKIALPTSNFNKCITLGQLVNEVIEEDIKLQGVNMSRFISKSNADLNQRLYNYYTDCSKARVAGRVQLFNGPQVINEAIQSFDVCSLYPYVMAVAPVYYPCGDIVEIKNYDDLPEGKIGFFYCDIDQSKMDVTMIPEKTKIGNNWEAKIIKNSFESTIMIKYIRKNGGIVTTRNGIYFTEKIKSSDYFRILLDVMKYKNQEDTNKKNKTNYNPALRETYKLVLNIMSGKLNQGLVTEKRKIVSSIEYELLTDSDKFKNLNTLYVLPNGKAHITYDVNELGLMGKCKNIFMGSLIYVYARIYMHKFIYSKIPREQLVYTDTDSCKTRNTFGEEWKKYASAIEVPHWPEVEKYDERYKHLKLYQEDDKIFGSLEDEYKDSSEPNDMSIFIAKKCYLTYHKETKYARIHFKGVSDNDKVLPDEIETKHLTPKDLCELYNNPILKSIKEDPYQFYMDLYNNHKNRILTFSMKKISKNSKKNVGFDDIERHQSLYMQICTVYGIKNLSY